MCPPPNVPVTSPASRSSRSASLPATHGPKQTLDVAKAETTVEYNRSQRCGDPERAEHAKWSQGQEESQTVVPSLTG